MTLFSAIAIHFENVKFAHTVFALPFALTAMFLAAASGTPTGASWMHRLPDAAVALLILGCMVAARSAAMTANRIHDRKLDARNPRTRHRPLPAGRLSAPAAWAFLAAAVAAFLACCAGFWLLRSNPWPMLLGPAAMAVLLGYPTAKRFTRLSHFWLGLALGLAPLGAWLATEPATLGIEAMMLSAAVMLWTAGFDILYACQDIAADRRDGLFSIPARLGVKPSLRISRCCHAAAAALLLAVGLLDPHLGWFHLSGVAVVATLLAWEHSLVSEKDLGRINTAFFTVNGLVSVAYALFAIADATF